jgi:hypothetical protein
MVLQASLIKHFNLNYYTGARHSLGNETWHAAKFH